MKMTVTNSINKLKEYNQKNWIDPLTKIAQALSPRSTVCFCTDYRNNKYLAPLLNVLLAHDITVHLCNKHTPDIFDMISGFLYYLFWFNRPWDYPSPLWRIEPFWCSYYGFWNCGNRWILHEERFPHVIQCLCPMGRCHLYDSFWCKL